MTNPGGPESSDRGQLDTLIAQYRDEALRVARRLVRSPVEAEDLTQTAILNVLRHANNIEDVANIRAYLLTAVRNLWRNQLRQQGRRRFVGADAANYLPSSDLGPEERALNVLDAALARVAFLSLSGTSQEILALRYVQGLAFSELAAQLGISQVAARQRAHRAREELIGACIEQTPLTTDSRTCSSVRSRLGRYLRGRLSRKIRAEMALHLGACTACARCYTEIIDLYGHLLMRPEGEP
jgi:RNA polymerase sigma-70 factor (ECF subfamily)